MANLTSSFNLNLKDYGHYIKDDKFRVKSIDTGERIARTRTFFLFEKVLILCKSKGDLYNYKEALLMDEYTIEDPATISAATSNSLNNSTSNGNTISSSLLDIGLIGNSGANAHSLVLYNNTNKKVS
jgi:hypothetical protein